MTESSRFWNTMNVGDGPTAGYGSAEIAAWIRAVFGSGILAGTLNELAVSGSASPLSVATGAALVDGAFYRNTAALNVTVSTPVGGTTGGRIVLRADWTAKTVRAVSVLNTGGNSSPPALTQTSGATYEISLCTFTITTGGVIGNLVVEPGRAIFATQLPWSHLVTATGLSVAGRASGSGNGQTLAAASVGLMLRRASGTLGFGQAATAGIANDAVTQAKIADGAVVAAMLDGPFDTAKFAANAITDVQAGNRVPQCYRRQGGDVGNWATPGTSNYDISILRFQSGVLRYEMASGVGDASVAITFPVAFAASPLVFVTIDRAVGLSLRHSAMIETPSTTGVTVRLFRQTPAAMARVDIYWLAVGGR